MMTLHQFIGRSNTGALKFQWYRRNGCHGPTETGQCWFVHREVVLRAGQRLLEQGEQRSQEDNASQLTLHLFPVDGARQLVSHPDVGGVRSELGSERRRQWSGLQFLKGFNTNVVKRFFVALTSGLLRELQLRNHFHECNVGLISPLSTN